MYALLHRVVGYNVNDGCPRVACTSSIVSGE